MNHILQILGKYIVWWGILTVLIVAGGGYFLIIAPKLAGIQGSTSKDVAEKQALIQANEAEIQRLRSLEEDLQSVTASEQRRLESVMPSAAELDDLYVQFSDLASGLGLSMVSLGFSDTGSSATGEEKQQLDGDIQTLDVTFTVDGVEGYDGLKQLLDTLHNNLRLIEMNSLSYTPDTTQYSLVLKLYYFNERDEREETAP